MGHHQQEGIRYLQDDGTYGTFGNNWKKRKKTKIDFKEDLKDEKRELRKELREQKTELKFYEKDIKRIEKEIKKVNKKLEDL